MLENLDKQERFKYLFYQHFERKATQEEKAELLDYIAGNEYDNDLKTLIRETYDMEIPGEDQNPETADQILQRILGREQAEYEAPVIPMRRRNWSRIAAAASILFIVALTVWLVIPTKEGSKPPIATTQDISAPGKTRATITLADGTTVPIDSLTSLTQGTVNITKTADGQILYEILRSAQDDRMVYNTLSNPRGSKVIDMTLADGSRVWLNAGSSVTYPVAFATNERKVTMTGEGYFEVAKDPRKKFIVEANGTSTEVLGTHFNVNAYDDEREIKVTLLEGSVRTSMVNGESAMLTPGQQALVSKNEKLKIKNNPDLEEVMAWKNGIFKFTDASLETVMKEMERWYDVEVVYQARPSMKFGGKIDRFSTLMQVVKILEESGVKFKLENKKLTVLAKRYRE